MSSAQVEDLRVACRDLWQDFLSNGKAAKLVLSGDVDRAFCAIYLIETFHYTRHNARNQALVGVRAEGISDAYRRFCFSHAADETGHENMALHDLLGAMNLTYKAVTLPEALPATEILVAYLYWISATGNPLQRLGYSYWAETCYEYINPIINVVRTKLQLKDSQMTFFRAHAEIDSEHAKAVEDMLLKYCKTEQDWADVRRVMTTSLKLTMAMVDAVCDAYYDLRAGKLKSHSFLLRA